MDMTKTEAIKAMKEGKKVTHTLFMSDEWMTIKNNVFVFEDGTTCQMEMFWKDRVDTVWQYGYTIFED
jgi:hypothetical protein